ncbi:hypothetical protein VTJ83DRAFT_5478 [Remersonia thermophila]|uniref:Seipin n=1 Tax=Remersonia thermophila TaxID=72144 RepID=A0ABR4D6Z4_9PEZI
MDLSNPADQAKRNLESALGIVRHGGRRAGRAAHAVVSSKWAQRLVVGTTLLSIVGALLYVPAALGYLLLYYKFLPELETHVPVHLQYGAGPHPFGIASLNGLVTRQPYDLTVSLTLPRSPPNLGRGNFMIALHLLAQADPAASSKMHPPLPYHLPDRTPSATAATATETTPTSSPDDPLRALQPTRLNLPSFLATHAVLYTTTRPALIPYVDPLADLASRLLFLPYHLLAAHPRTATVRLEVPMAEDLVFGGKASSLSSAPQELLPRVPERVLLEVQAGQDLQVYEASVTVAARLRGLRGVMYRWRVTAFVLCTAAFWVAEVAVLGIVAALVLGLDLGGLLAGAGKESAEGESDGHDDDDTRNSDGEDWRRREEKQKKHHANAKRGRSRRGESSDEEGEGPAWERGRSKTSAIKMETTPSARSSSASASASPPRPGSKKKGKVKREKEEEREDALGELYKVPAFEGGGEEGGGKDKGRAVPGEEDPKASKSHDDVGVGTSFKGHGPGSARKRTVTPGSQEGSE